MTDQLPTTIEECHALIENLLKVIEQMQLRQEKMQAEIDDLRSKLNRHSGNSHQPPSLDGFKRRVKSAMPKKQGTKGGQIGHQGKTVQMVQMPDQVKVCEPESCQCGKTKWVGEGQIVERRQVFDLPDPRLEITEYLRVVKSCECGETVSGKFPEAVTAPVQYGVKVQAMTALLSVHGCLSYEKISQLFSDLYGYQLNEATAQTMVEKTAQQMPVAQIREAIIESELVHFDETGIRECGKTRWLHTASTSELTYQFVDAKRGVAAMRSEKSVLPEFAAVAMHDCWASYFSFGQMEHALCNAHIMRELAAIIENEQSRWGAEMKELLLELYVASNYGKAVVKEISKYEEQYEAILLRGAIEEPPPERVNEKGKLKRTKGRNLLERLSKYKESVIMFAKREEVPFTNNQAERDIRPLKVKQRVCGSFRSEKGSESYARIYSFISTLRKKKREVFAELKSVLEGNPFVLSQT